MERRGTCRDCEEEDVLFPKNGNGSRNRCRTCLRNDTHRRLALWRERQAQGTRLPFGQPCGCCGEPMLQPKLDHDHKTGVIREWICHGDNAALGWRRDDPVAFLEVAEEATKRAARLSGPRMIGEMDKAIRNLQRAGYLLKHR